MHTYHNMCIYIYIYHRNICIYYIHTNIYEKKKTYLGNDSGTSWTPASIRPGNSSNNLKSARIMGSQVSFQAGSSKTTWWHWRRPIAKDFYRMPTPNNTAEVFSMENQGKHGVSWGQSCWAISIWWWQDKGIAKMIKYWLLESVSPVELPIWWYCRI